MMFGRKANSEVQKPGRNLLGRLLLVVEGSEASVAATNFAVRLAQQLDSQIVAVYVVDTATMDYLVQMKILVTEERAEFERDLETTGRRYLEYAATIAKKVGIDVDTRLERGRLHQRVIGLARALEADAVIMGGTSTSVTRKDSAHAERQLVIEQVSCPVIVIKESVRSAAP